jgi:predicted ester cyclase
MKERLMALDLNTARKLVGPIYDALTRPGEKDVETLIKSVTATDFQSCASDTDCAGREAVIARFKGLASVILDLAWTIKEIFVSGDDTVVVRGEATGTPVKVFLGVQPTGRSFRTMSLDLYTVANSQIIRSYHVENWTLAARQLTTE